MIDSYSFLRWLWTTEDRFFDWRHGIDTSGFIPCGDLQTDSPNKPHGTAYHAAWCHTIRTLIRRSFAAGIRPRGFIDVGCGRGKACFYAATTGKFQRITGIEFIESLVTQAKEFSRHFKQQISFIHADVLSFDFENEPQSFIFLFNPFDAVMMDAFLRKNLDAFREKKHVLAYSNDTQREGVQQLGFRCLFRDPKRKMSLWQL